ncbi:hypothetical protein ACROYT_G023569 [Oculina patagonica]
MKGLVRLENALSKSLDSYLEQRSDAPEILRQFADHVRKERNIAANDIEKYVFHPINSFQLVRRFIRHWRELESYLAKGSPNDLQGELVINRPAFPTSQDFMGSISAILRIQDVYNLSARAIADGELHQEKNSGGLGADECYELGIVSNDQGNYEDVIEWMKEALKRMSLPNEYSGALTKIDVLEYLSWAEYKVGRLDDAIRHTQDILNEDPTIKQAHINLGHFKTEQLQHNTHRDHQSKDTANNNKKRKHDFMSTYERLCRGESRKTRIERDKLSCYYNRNLPTQLLKPVKVEMLNLDPDLYLFHDVITDSEIEHVKKLARPQLKRAVVTNSTTGNQLEAGYRISQSAWLEDSDSPIINRISQRIQTITGLSLDPQYSEPLQVANYGIGGHYEPHHDFVQNADGSLPANETGDRISTFLFYLSDVDAGGATVFLDVEEVVYPRKGDAVFWYNLGNDGRPDVKTRHAACPVIVGSKWVANKWINERGQEFRRPCKPT